jgi:hypothetical protein
MVLVEVLVGLRFLRYKAPDPPSGVSGFAEYIINQNACLPH